MPRKGELHLQLICMYSGLEETGRCGFSSTYLRERVPSVFPCFLEE